MAQLATVKEVAATLGVKPQWVYEHKCELGYVDLGRNIRFDRRSIDRYIVEHTHDPKRKVGRPRKSVRRTVRRIEWCDQQNKPGIPAGAYYEES
jgi:predicted DNA-binding transcriptional regulator AlpA